MEIETPLCTYTNVGAHKYNQMIRNSMFFLNANIEPYYPDERLISNGSITLNKQLLVKNNAVVRVKHYKSSSLTSSLGNTITGYDVTLQQTSKNKPIILFTPITPEAGKTYISNIAKGARKLQNIKNRGKITPEQDIQRRDLWKEMFNAQGSMGDLRPPYAQTTHKAQGATHDSVYIDLQDIMKCRQHTLRARLLYVALTRAKTNCYIREDIK
jgi:ATP-dependent exoDNAse (exonuclease V) alpha subunit